jgi:hypothetical protein
MFSGRNEVEKKTDYDACDGESLILTNLEGDGSHHP